MSTAAQTSGTSSQYDRGAPSNAMALTVSLCFLAALFEGLDIVITGIVGPQLTEVFAMSATQFGNLSSSSTFGLFLGAVAGGWIADRIGRKKVLVASMLIFGLMTLAATTATSYTTLVLLRFLTGLGLGGAMPNLIALCAESGPPHLRTTLVTLMFSGVPIGGALGGMVALWGGANQNWKILFYYGGLGPLLLGVLLLFLLPESRLFHQAKAERASHAAAGTTSRGPGLVQILFGQGRLQATLYLALAFFCTLIAIYMMINWLPKLLVSRGFTRTQAAIVLTVFNAAGGAGAIILGRLMDRISGRTVMVATYVGMVLSLLGMLYAFGQPANNTAFMSTMAFFGGFFVIGAQLVLYGMAPRYYATPIRATGVGSSIAAGRVGSVVGPILAGLMVGAGANAQGVVKALIPFVIIAGISAFLLVLRPTTSE